jgi:hypothetical protein
MFEVIIGVLVISVLIGLAIGAVLTEAKVEKEREARYTRMLRNSLRGELKRLGRM